MACLETLSLDLPNLPFDRLRRFEEKVAELDRDCERILARTYRSRSRRALRQSRRGYPDLRPGYEYDKLEDMPDDEFVTPTGIAFHEAGHAIVAAALGVTVAEVWTARQRLNLIDHQVDGTLPASFDPNQPELFGESRTMTMGAAIMAFEPERLMGEVSVWHRMVITAAGPASQLVAGYHGSEPAYTIDGRTGLSAALTSLEASPRDGEGPCDVVKLAGLAIREAAYVFPDWKTMPDGRLFRFIEDFVDMAWADACTILSRFETVVAVHHLAEALDASPVVPGWEVYRLCRKYHLDRVPLIRSLRRDAGLPETFPPYDPRHPDLPLYPCQDTSDGR